MTRISPTLWHNDLLYQHFDALSDMLATYEDIWKLAAFQHRILPWVDSYPELASYLASLDSEGIDRLDASLEDTVEMISPYLPEAPSIYAMSQIGAWPHQIEDDKDSSLFYAVPALKVGQIQAFATSLPAIERPLLDWCSGKGHLARVLSILSEQPADCLEVQGHLCEDGAALAERQNVALDFHEVDVLQPKARDYLHHFHHAVALHACGRLHRRLLEHCTHQRTHTISLSPCCYFKGESPQYQTFSQHAATSALSLTRDNIRLATREVVTARPKRIKYRDHNNRWRMGFDLLQRDVRGIDEYLTAPSVHRQMLKGSFENFCRHIAATKDLALPDGINYDDYEKRGAIRYRETFAFELIRSLFRRPLELWLVLDRAIFLHEQGYNVTLGTFCERHLTPRNLLLHAERNDSH